MIKTRDIGSRRELFVDDWLIDTMVGTRLQLTQPERREAVFTGDAPWEDQHAFPFDVIQDGDVVRMHYRASVPDLTDETVSVMAMLESRDGGRTFTRPDLGLVEFNGSQHNNIVYRGGFPGFPEMFIDTNPNCPPHQRFKGFANRYQQLMPMASADGLRWKPLLDAPLPMPGQFDTINTAFWDTEAGCYRCYTRRWCDPRSEVAVRDVDLKNFDGDNWVRCIQHATSPDFIHWSEPEPLHYADGNRYRVNLYTNAILSCTGAEHIHLGFPNRFIVEGVGSGKLYLRNDALFMASRDGLHWNRRLDAWVRPGLDDMNWTHRNNYPVWGIAQTSPVEWSMYITEHYARAPQPTRVRRLSIRPWGFASVHGDYSGGGRVRLRRTQTQLHLHPRRRPGLDQHVGADG